MHAEPGLARSTCAALKHQKNHTTAVGSNEFGLHNVYHIQISDKKRHSNPLAIDSYCTEFSLRHTKQYQKAVQYRSIFIYN